MRSFLLLLIPVLALAETPGGFGATSDRTAYQLTDRVQVTVEYRNDTDTSVWVYASLGLPMVSGIDVNGNEIYGEPLYQHVPIPPRRTGEFLLLHSGHYFGTVHEFTMEELGVVRPGEYTFFIQHLMPSPKLVGLRGRAVSGVLRAPPFKIRVTSP